MKISINVQSYKRAGFVTTLNVFPDANVWVHEFEVDAYRALYGDRVRVLPDALRGSLPKVKNFILDKELQDNDWCLFVDDDISELGYHEKKKHIAMSQAEALAFVYRYSLVCQEWGYYLWGVNVNFDKQCYREYSPFSTLSYVSSSFACFRKGVEPRYDDRFPLKEDYDMTIQMCQKYRGLLRVNKAFYAKKSMTNAGGCATYRNTEREREQLALLQKKWGTKIVQADSLDNSRSHNSAKTRSIDINPILYLPIRGI